MEGSRPSNKSLIMVPVMRTSLLIGSLWLGLGAGTQAETLSYTVQPVTIADEKAVFATVESVTPLPARVRTGGTVRELLVKEGDKVASGQLLAILTDAKLDDRVKAAAARLAVAQAQAEQSEREEVRNRPLLDAGVVSPQRLEEVETQARQSAAQLRAATAERAALAQAVEEGKVLAPAAGRVIALPAARGAVMAEGETLAMIATIPFTVRMRLPESHAAGLRKGDPVRFDGGNTGVVTYIHPHIENGTVVVDALAEGAGDYFVGQRLHAVVAAGARGAILVPAALIVTRFGLDYVKLRQADGGTAEVPVQRGRAVSSQGQPAAVEILSGLQAGDVVVGP